MTRGRPMHEDRSDLIRRMKDRFRGTFVHRAYRSMGTLAERVRRGRQAVRGLLLSHPLSLFGWHPSYYYPRLLAIFLTTRCNLRCFICRREGFKGEDLDFGQLEKLSRAIRHARTIDLTGWGECLMYPRFSDVVRYIGALNPRPDILQITTNGTLLSSEVGELLRGHLGKMVISLNAATADTYDRDMKGGRFGKTIGNIRSFLSALDAGERGRVSLYFVAHTANYLEIPEYVRLAASLGLGQVTVGQYLVSTEEHRSFSLLEVKDAYNAVVDESELLARELGVGFSARRFFSEQARERGAWLCGDPVNACFIGVEGDVGPCCFAGSYRIGNVYEEGFESVWFGPAYRKLRRHRHLDACRRCTPFIPFDDPRAHLTEYLKERETSAGGADDPGGKP